MPRKDTRKRTGDRHKRPSRSWRPDEETYEAAQAAASEVSNSLNAYLRLSVLYLLGLRKNPPPRPEWAERRAARLPDEGESQEGSDSED